MENENIKIIRSRRRTLALEVAKDASLIIRAPLFLPKYHISKFIQQKSQWIKEKQREVLNKKSASKLFVEGENFLYLGEIYKLQIVDWQEKSLFLEDNFRISRDKIGQAKTLFTKWYKEKAHEVITERTLYYSALFGLQFNKVRISSAEKRWGSCSNKKNLNFNWRLIMAPIEVIDYVVIHELSHLIEQNHSRSFWNLVAKSMPDYKKHKKWLHNNGHNLNI